jgi:hypothetical protein
MFTEDLTAFFDVDEMGTLVTKSDTNTFVAIFDNQALIKDVMSGQVINTNPKGVCSSDDLSGLKQDDSLMISDTQYFITSILPDGTGVSEFELTLEDPNG